MKYNFIIILIFFYLFYNIGTSYDIDSDLSEMLNKHPEVKKIQKRRISEIINVFDLVQKDLHKKNDILAGNPLFCLIYGGTGSSIYKGIYIYSKGVYTITISDKCPFITFYDTSEMNLEQKNLFSNIVSFYKKNYTLYNKYKGDLSRFGSDITLAMFIWGLSNKKLNTFFIDCIDQKSNKYILNQANIIYKLIQEFYKSLTQDTATVSGA